MKTSKQLRQELDDELVDYLADDEFERQALRLPAMKVWVQVPGKKTRAPMWAVIPYLNDHLKWPRERIADWLDSLHDNGTVDLSFENTKEIL